MDSNFPIIIIGISIGQVSIGKSKIHIFFLNYKFVFMISG